MSRRMARLYANLGFVAIFSSHTRCCSKSRFIPTIECDQNIFCNRARERSWQVLKPTGILVSLTSPIPEGEAAAHSRRGLFFIVEPNREQLGEIAALIDSGAIRPVIAETIPLARAREAFERGVAGHTRG